MTETERMQPILEKAKKLKLLILDVDGVLTDGKLFFDNEGNEYKAFHARDGHGIKLLRQTGVDVAVISGRKSNSVALRMKNLGIEHVYQGHENKIAAFNEIIEKMGILPEQAAHVGQHILHLERGLAIHIHPVIRRFPAGQPDRGDLCLLLRRIMNGERLGCRSKAGENSIENDGVLGKR